MGSKLPVEAGFLCNKVLVIAALLSDTVKRTLCYYYDDKIKGLGPLLTASAVCK
jgi:hypothetical protein